MGNEDGSALSLRHRSRRGEERRWSVWVEESIGASRLREPDDELMASIGCRDKRFNDQLLQSIESRRRTQCWTEKSEIRVSQRCQASTSLLLGQLHSIGRM